jgi:hypothetical protein
MRAETLQLAVSNLWALSILPEVKSRLLPAGAVNPGL